MLTGMALIHLSVSICHYVSKLKLALDHSQVKDCTMSENVHKIPGNISWSLNVIYRLTAVNKIIHKNLYIHGAGDQQHYSTTRQSSKKTAPTAQV